MKRIRYYRMDDMRKRSDNFKTSDGDELYAVIYEADKYADICTLDDNVVDSIRANGVIQLKRKVKNYLKKQGVSFDTESRTTKGEKE